MPTQSFHSAYMPNTTESKLWDTIKEFCIAKLPDIDRIKGVLEWLEMAKMLILRKSNCTYKQLPSTYQR